ncbi:uncharacterized protein LOC660934 [Tribolium castaneum]|uniref:PID domain-containing protein n=1 Tax=Tribolium castaneum TaxID=7070 RepID=D2A4Q8_TRICA|nr:PREDICTED: uncharacterized protein LOC660934 [Tribolium castaneum]EFA05191.2 hypothetical protein TcasGA2_TC015324 [Tribolium castaneum]|eukprot:XP_972221.1 PREDICTED: uncharacterized protein LOC660934 [Tribolium castaneum]
MALKLRKDIKKSSYYVWFLGAKESKGLRGSEYVLPVIKHLEAREKDIEPFKVTLQVSHKGLKIVQNVVSQKGTKPKNETIKHFIPHNTITCVYQHEDVIACILLLFNPVTKCPLHVHAYRCDSLETATLLKQQLQTLIERPENQKKFAEIEGRLKGAKEGRKGESSVGSDTGTSTRESESSEERYTVETTRVTTLYDSVAAELREKLAKNNVPILLPPRDYDTVHRQKGNLTGIELRRCLNANIVGQNAKGRRLESSGGSSGIGSDHPPSPDSPDAPDTRFNTLDNQSTSDEDWNGDPADSTLYLMHAPPQVTLPRPNREKSPDSPRYYNQSKPTPRDIAKYLEKPISKYVERHEKPMKYFDDDGFDENLRYRNRPRYDFPPVPKTRQRIDPHYYPQRSPSPVETSPRDRFKDAKEKFLSMEKERLTREPPISPIKRHESMMYAPKPAPRHASERDAPIGRYRNDKYDPKRRSMFSLIEEEHRKNSNEIAREIKRRSYMDDDVRDTNYNLSKSTVELNQKGGYRHSYAEPKLRVEKGGGKKHFEMLHRTNSVTNNGRVGIASVHPY